MEKNQLRQRVITRLTELDIGPVEAAERIPGLERNYIRDLVEEKKQSFSHAKMPLVAQALDWTMAELTGESPLKASQSRKGEGTLNQPIGVNPSVRNPTLQTFPGEQLMGKIDLPIYSIASGGRGALVMSNEPYTLMARPHNLLGIKESYGVLVKGDSMAKEYKENDIAYVDPHRHPKKGDACVFQNQNDDGTVTAIIKYLERSPDASETVFYVSQSNPPKKFTIKKADWQSCSVLVGKISGA